MATPWVHAYTVAGRPQSIEISWSEQVYSVTFTAGNLTAGIDWEVTLGGYAEQGTVDSLSFSEPNGSYAFTVVPKIPYGASPSVGGVRVAGAPVSQVITFFQTPPPPTPLTVRFYYTSPASCGSGPVTVTFTSSVSAGTPPYTYDWNFGDGTPGSSDADPTHEFTSLHGGAPVTLVVTDANGTRANYSTPLEYPGIPLPCPIQVQQPVTNPSAIVIALGIVTVGVILASAAVLLFVYRKRQP